MGEILYTLPDLDNVTDPYVPLAGWVSSGKDRGSIDILWSSCLTIFLCCWVATHPNACAPRDKWYHTLIDKFHLAMVGFLGPDFLLGIAVGQFSSAWRSVKNFKQDESLKRHGTWTLQYGFFVDMGGIHLKSPDFSDTFPINTEQLFYLVKHGHVDFPNMDDFNIQERNMTDRLSRIITAWQVLWFSVAELQRIQNGLPMTTLELTALTFVPMMLATSVCWYRKPSITKPMVIQTRNEKLIEDIRAESRASTHPELSPDPDDWYRTPLDFIGDYRWGIAAHWAYYTGLAEILRLRVVSRPIRGRMWTRYPSDLWLPPERSLLVYIVPVMLFFSISFLFAWNFFFPTFAEQLIWRISSAYHAFFSIYGGLYYLLEALKWTRARRKPTERIPSHTSSFTPPPRSVPLNRTHIMNEEEPASLFQRVTASLRNVSSNRDPQMALPLRLTLPVTLTCLLYINCRIYLYIEDFISFRMQPVGVYITVNKFLPFVG